MLKVDFNPQSGPTETGFEGVSLTKDDGSEGPITFTDPFDIGEDVDVSYDISGSKDRARDEGDNDLTDSPINLVREWLGPRNKDDTITLTLDLPEGEYDLLSYHHLLQDLPQNAAKASVTVNGTAAGEALGTRSDTSLDDIGTFETSFTVGAGGGSVDIVYTNLGKIDDSGDNQPFGLNGFELTLVPEPGSLSAIAGLGGLLLFRRHR